MKPEDQDETMERGYSSPPCYAHEIAPGYFGEQVELPKAEQVAPPKAELLALLNTLLEAQRKIAEVLPRIEAPCVREKLREMHDSNLRSIEACNDLLKSLP
jgi:hypothetical protein